MTTITPAAPDNEPPARPLLLRLLLHPATWLVPAAVALVVAIALYNLRESKPSRDLMVARHDLDGVLRVLENTRTVPKRSQDFVDSDYKNNFLPNRERRSAAAEAARKQYQDAQDRLVRNQAGQSDRNVKLFEDVLPIIDRPDFPEERYFEFRSLNHSQIAELVKKMLSGEPDERKLIKSGRLVGNSQHSFDKEIQSLRADYVRQHPELWKGSTDFDEVTFIMEACGDDSLAPLLLDMVDESITNPTGSRAFLKPEQAVRTYATRTMAWLEEDNPAWKKYVFQDSPAGSVTRAAVATFKKWPDGLAAEVTNRLSSQEQHDRDMALALVSKPLAVGVRNQLFPEVARIVPRKGTGNLSADIGNGTTLVGLITLQNLATCQSASLALAKTNPALASYLASNLLTQFPDESLRAFGAAAPSALKALEPFRDSSSWFQAYAKDPQARQKLSELSEVLYVDASIASQLAINPELCKQPGVLTVATLWGGRLTQASLTTLANDKSSSSELKSDLQNAAKAMSRGGKRSEVQP